MAINIGASMACLPDPTWFRYHGMITHFEPRMSSTCRACHISSAPLLASFSSASKEFICFCTSINTCNAHMAKNLCFTARRLRMVRMIQSRLMPLPNKSTTSPNVMIVWVIYAYLCIRNVFCETLCKVHVLGQKQCWDCSKNVQCSTCLRCFCTWSDFFHVCFRTCALLLDLLQCLLAEMEWKKPMMIPRCSWSCLVVFTWRNDAGTATLYWNDNSCSRNECGPAVLVLRHFLHRSIQQQMCSSAFAHPTRPSAERTCFTAKEWAHG